MRVPGSWLAEEVQVRGYGGAGARGPVSRHTVPGLAGNRATRQPVRPGWRDEVVSEVTLRLPPSAVDVITPESEVVVRGRVTRALTVRPMTVRGDVVYVEVTTT